MSKPKDEIRYGGRTIRGTGLADFMLKRIQELNREDQAMREKLSPEGKRYDPNMHKGLAVKGFECRVHPRWYPSGAKSGKPVTTIDFCGLTVCPEVTDLASYQRVQAGRVPKYIRENGRLGG